MVRGFLFRSISRAKWTPSPDTPDVISQAALADLESDDGCLSMYLTGVGDVTTERVIAAFAAGRPRLTHLDYALVSPSDLDADAILHTPANGRTPDKSVNDQHYDIDTSSVERKQVAAVAIFKAQTPARIPERKVTELVLSYIEAGHIDETLLNESMRIEVEKARMKRTSQP